MKTISLICCILLAFLLFSSPSIMARELAAADHDHEADGTTVGRNKINDPSVPGKSCGSPEDPQYAACTGKQKPKPCSKSNPYRRCNPPAQG